MKTLCYRTILLDEYIYRCKKNQKYSRRAFARDLDLSPAFLSQVLNRKRELSENAAHVICDRLGWSTDRRKIFLLVVRQDKCENLREKMQIKSEIDKCQGHELNFEFVDLEYSRIISDWYHFAIIELTELDDFNSDHRWVAQKLGITPATAECAISRLLQFGFLEEDSAGNIKKTAEYFTTPNVKSKSIREGHKQSIQLALNSVDSQSSKEGDMSEILMATCPQKIEEAKTMIRNFRRELMTFLESGEKTQLYNANIQLFRLDKDIHS